MGEFSKNGSKMALIALGANLPSDLGSPSQTLSHATAEIAKCGFDVVAKSRFFQTPAFPKGAGPDYVNAAIACKARHSAAQLMDQLHRIEAECGRERQIRWGQRTLDLDLIAFGDLVLPDLATQKQWRTLPVHKQTEVTPETLILPHPRLQDRGFVLGPLMDVAPEWRHPLLGKTIKEMWEELSEQARKELTPLARP